MERKEKMESVVVHIDVKLNEVNATETSLVVVTVTPSNTPGQANICVDFPDTAAVVTGATIEANTLDAKMPSRKTAYEKAESMIKRLEDDSFDSLTEWGVLQDAYIKLQKLPKLNNEMKMLMELIENTIDKFKGMDNTRGSVLKSDSYRRWQNDEDAYLGGSEEEEEDSCP